MTAKDIINQHGKDGVGEEVAAYAIGLGAYFLAHIAITAVARKIAKLRIPKEHEKNLAASDELSKEYMSEYADIKEFSDDDPPRKIKGEHDMDQDAAAVNPLFDQNNPATSTNCVQCSVTYEMRRRGYDVTAKMCSTGTYTDSLLSDLFDGKPEKLETKNAMKWSDVESKAVEKFPEGSRGLIAVSGAYGMGHAMAFEIRKGKMTIIDSQCANSDVKMNSKKYSSFVPRYTKLYRLDNLGVKTSSIGKSSAQLKPNWKKNASPTARNQKIVDEYRKEHPNSKLSDADIIANYSSV